MNTWKQNLEKTKQHYINWWNHKGIVLNMWEHFQEGVTPHADIPEPKPYRNLDQRWFDPEWRAQYLDWYVAHSSLKADILPVANTQLGPGSLAAAITVGTSLHSAELATGLANFAGGMAGCVLIGLAVYFTYRFAHRLLAPLGETGIIVFLRMSAFILLCLGVQIMWNGASALLAEVLQGALKAGGA